VLGTGGTIAASLKDGSLTILPVAEVGGTLPSDLPSTEFVDLHQLSSSDLRPSDMLDVARAVGRSLRDGVTGVVVTHGTDTLELTAYLTELLLGDASRLGGVVFTGAMRLASDPSPDGPANLADAIRVAAAPQAKGVGVLAAFAGEVHSARWITKADTATRQPFVSPIGPVGHIVGGEVTVRLRPARRWTSSDDIETRVVLVKAYPGMARTSFDALVDEGARGIVIEGFGVMNLPHDLIPAIQRATETGVAVVVASRARTAGGLDQGPTGHRHLHGLGAVGSYGLPADKAWLALMVGLANTDGTPEALRHWLATVTEVHPT